MSSPHFHWFLPTGGDAREVVGWKVAQDERANGDRRASLSYLTQVALAAQTNGFEAVLTPTGTWCLDAWITTAALIDATDKLKFLVALRPGLTTPTLAAQQAAAFQHLSHERLLLNVVTGGDPTEQARFGDFATKEDRYERTDEFLQIFRGAFERRPFDFEGKYTTTVGAAVGAGLDVLPPIFLGGSSDAARQVAARSADTYLSWTEPPEAIAHHVHDVRARAAALGRDVTIGIRAHVITRDTHEQAWSEARRLLEGIDPAAIQAMRAGLANTQSEGQLRQLALSADADNLEVYPGLWAGYGLVRPGAGTAFVGSHAEVADLIREYHRIGVDHFILSGQPHIEEAYWVGEGVVTKFANHSTEPDTYKTSERIGV